MPVDLGDVASTGAVGAVAARDRTRRRARRGPGPGRGRPATPPDCVSSSTILVDNAIRHAPAGSRVDVRVRADGADARRWSSRTRGPVSGRRTCRASSTGSTAPPGRPVAGPGSGWRSRPGSSSATEAGSGSRTASRTGRASWSVYPGATDPDQHCAGGLDSGRASTVLRALAADRRPGVPERGCGLLGQRADDLATGRMSWTMPTLWPAHSDSASIWPVSSVRGETEP